jgi:DNA repair protein RadD
LNSIEKFGNEFAMVILDECHNITPTFKDIVEKIPNPNLRVVGMSATPFRMGSGYVFKQWPDGGEAGTNGYFTRCVYRITAPELISQGFLTPPIIGKPDAESYATKGMQLNSMGQFRKDDVDRAYHGHGRKTSAIVADIVAKSEDRRGVLIFAATVAHAHECLASLPPELSAIVTAKTTKREREDILRRFKAQELKYLVNVAVLTTGFDATHVDVIAVLRATESVGLLMQIIGRGLRLHPGKENCLIVDYAENIERHCPNGDLFDPLVKEKEASEGVKIKVECPLCSVDNWFSARVNLSGYKVNKPGYFIDLDGNPIMGPHGPIPAHYGRRCTAVHLVGNELHRCPYRWTEKECPHCEHKNDIAARYCEECKIELVDPNAKLVTFNNKKKDPTQVQCDEVEGWTVNSSISQSGNPMWRINVATPYRSFQIYVQKMPTFSKAIAAKRLFDSLGGGRPKTIKYRKNPSTNYFEVISFNEKPDEAPRGH